MNYAGGDYVQLMNGNGLDTSLMTTQRLFCGMESSNGGYLHVLSFVYMFFGVRVRRLSATNKWQQSGHNISTFLWHGVK